MSEGVWFLAWHGSAMPRISFEGDLIAFESKGLNTLTRSQADVEFLVSWWAHKSSLQEAESRFQNLHLNWVTGFRKGSKSFNALDLVRGSNGLSRSIFSCIYIFRNYCIWLWWDLFGEIGCWLSLCLESMCFIQEYVAVFHVLAVEVFIYAGDILIVCSDLLNCLLGILIKLILMIWLLILVELYINLLCMYRSAYSIVRVILLSLYANALLYWKYVVIRIWVVVLLKKICSVLNHACPVRLAAITCILLRMVKLVV